MRKFLFLFLCVNIGLQAQTWSHAKLDPNYNCWNEVHTSVLDANNNLYMAGTFEPCYHGGGAYGMYLNKYDLNGNLVWSDTVCARTLGVTALFLTNNNTLRLIGPFYNDTTDFFGFIFNSNDTAIGYQAEFDLAGNCLQAGLLPYTPMKAQLNPDGTMSMAGQCFQPITNLNFQPQSTFFVGRFSDFSTAYWLKAVSFGSFQYKTEIETASNGDIYLYEYNGQVKRHSASSTTTISLCSYPKFHNLNNSFYMGSGYSPGILEKYNSSGALLWQKNFGNSFTFISNITSYNNRLFISGYFRNSFQYGSFYSQVDTGTTYFSNLFLLETDTNGNELHILYAKHAIPNGNYTEIKGVGLHTNGNGIYVTGEIQGYMLFGTDTLKAGNADPNFVFHAKADLYNAAAVTARTNRLPDFYPNPFSDKTSIGLNDLNNDDEIQLTLFSSEGRAVTSGLCNGKVFTLNREELNSGIYFYRIVNKQGILLSSGKIIAE